MLRRELIWADRADLRRSTRSHESSASHFSPGRSSRRLLVDLAIALRLAASQAAPAKR